MATGYVKIWTAMKRNIDFRRMNCLERGVWFQLLLECKDQDDNGIVTANSVSHLGSTFKVNRTTLSNLCQKWQEAGLIDHQKNEAGLEIKIHNYQKWQQATVADVRGYVSEPRQKSQPQEKNKKPLVPDQTIPDYTKPEQSMNPHKDFLEFIEKNKERIFDRLSQVAFRILGSEQELWDKVVLGTAVSWIRENPEKASASLAQNHTNNWLLFIERWIWRDWKKKNDEINRNRGMSRKEEQDHYRDKAKSGREPLPASVREIVNKVFEKKV